jgi:hypothetical protein
MVFIWLEMGPSDNGGYCPHKGIDTPGVRGELCTFLCFFPRRVRDLGIWRTLLPKTHLPEISWTFDNTTLPGFDTGIRQVSWILQDTNPAIDIDGHSNLGSDGGSASPFAHPCHSQQTASQSAIVERHYQFLSFVFSSPRRQLSANHRTSPKTIATLFFLWKSPRQLQHLDRMWDGNKG